MSQRSLARLALFAIVICGVIVSGRLPADDDGLPKVTSPRATSGDSAVEPKWDERVTITVGNKEGDLIGSNEKVLQAAVDSVARLGGGTVKVLPGTYRLRNSVYLASKVRIVGSGAESVLIKEPSTKTKLSVDSDWYDQEVTLDDASGFRVGDGVVIRTKNPHNGGATVLKRTLVARSGNRFKLDKALRENVWQMGEPTIATSFPLISGEFLSDCVIENITLDGNREKNDHFDGNYSGCIFLQDCQRMTMRGVEARNNNGDGISWQICHDIVVENCHSHDNADLGLASRQRLAAAADPRQSDRALQHRHLLLLGREVRPRREEHDRRHPHGECLNRPSRHRQHRPRQRHQEQRPGRSPLPS